MNTKEIDYERIKHSFSFDDLFSDQQLLNILGIINAEKDKAGSTKQSSQFNINDNMGSSRIVVYNNFNKNTSPIYVNTDNDNDKGDIIQFVTNRINETSEKKAKYEAARILSEKLGNYIPNSNDLTINSNKNKERVFDLKKYEDKGLFEAKTWEEDKEHFLSYKRGITEETLTSPLFDKRVYFYTPFDTNKNYLNAFFPKYNKNNEIVGAEIKFSKPGKTGNTNFMEGQPKYLWTCNIPEKLDKVVIVESAIDALSHYQKYNDNNTFYVSTNGNFYKDRIDYFFEILNPLDPDKNITIIMASDNDIAGFKYDISMMNILSPGNKYDIIKTDKYIELKYTLLNSKIENLTETVNYFEKIKEAINFKEVSKDIGINDFVKIEKGVSHVSMIFPDKELFEKNSRKISISLNQSLSYFKSSRLEIQRPPQSCTNKIKDWNDLLKKLAEDKKQEESYIKTHNQRKKYYK